MVLRNSGRVGSRRFPEKKADIKEAIFEEIYINNTSSTRARLIFEKETVLGKIKRTVITY